MIKFLTPLDTMIETSDLSTFFEYVPGIPGDFTYVINTSQVPSITDHPYEYIRAIGERLASPGLEYGPYGASRVFCNSDGFINLPFNNSQRAFNPVIKYKVNGSTVSICLYTKTPVNGDSGYQLYNDSSAQTIELVTSEAVNNTQARGNFCYYKDLGGNHYSQPLINNSDDSPQVPTLGTSDVMTEKDLISILNSLIISKAWVEEYVKEQLEVAIPKAVSQAVKESEQVISQRYVSR